jgi:hypothetical protein
LSILGKIINIVKDNSNFIEYIKLININKIYKVKKENMKGTKLIDFTLPNKRTWEITPKSYYIFKKNMPLKSKKNMKFDEFIRLQADLLAKKI